MILGIACGTIDIAIAVGIAFALKAPEGTKPNKKRRVRYRTRRIDWVDAAL